MHWRSTLTSKTCISLPSRRKAMSRAAANSATCFAAAAEAFGGAGVAPGDENFTVGAHHLLDFGEGFSFTNNHNFRPLEKYSRYKNRQFFRVRPAAHPRIALIQNY